ncbi:MAG: ATP-dependent helicase [Spirochaetaceae bacterium]|nr:ATP-dependent helicase [Spirochaetaceae bacterium]
MTGSQILPPYLSSLNPEQLRAVLHEGSPLLILAGAGTGKTRVITTKIAYLVREKGVSPESILAVTFTNKAAKEMRERAMAIEPQCSRATIRTFHSFGAWFLRRNASAIALDSNFVIYDDDDSTQLIRTVLPQASKQECERYATLISRAKDYNLEPDSPSLDRLGGESDLRRVYALYEERLRTTGNVDFGDLIRLPARLLETDEAVAQRTHQRFRVILVDEYQDSNVAQFFLLQKLAAPGSYVCVVGDDDQSIYRFRGAEVKNILSFSNSFPGTTIIRLERNYRSSQSILDIAGNVVSHNKNRLGKTLHATKPGGAKPQLALLDDQDQEVEFCSHIIRGHLKSGGNLSDIAILYRTNAQSLAFEKEFPRRKIGYRLVGALRFYEREEVKDLLAYLAFLLNPRDEIAFRRIVNKPTRGIGESSVDSLLDLALQKGCSIMDSCLENRDAMKGKAKAGLKEFLDIIQAASSLLELPSSDIAAAEETRRGTGAAPKGHDKGTQSLSILLENIIEKSGLAEFHKNKDEIAGTQKLNNMEELVNAASIYPLVKEGLAEFLETIDLDRSLQTSAEDISPDAVTLITMHNTKGLEFPVVIITGLEQGLFPRDDESGEELEEQRRLFYVALTRAKDRIYLTACRWRRIHGRLFETLPSRFLTEIDAGLYEFWGAGGREGYRTGNRTGYAGAVSSEWKTGMAVYHDEYGQGVIIKTSMTESSGPLVIVQFETGKVAQFFPKYTRKLERIKE